MILLGKVGGVLVFFWSLRRFVRTAAVATARAVLTMFVTAIQIGALSMLAVEIARNAIVHTKLRLWTFPTHLVTSISMLSAPQKDSATDLQVNASALMGTLEKAVNVRHALGKLMECLAYGAAVMARVSF